jgi:hypothetical protein
MPPIGANLEPKPFEGPARLGILSREAHSGEAGHLAEPGFHIDARSHREFGQAASTIAIRLQPVQPSFRSH